MTPSRMKRDVALWLQGFSCMGPGEIAFQSSNIIMPCLRVRAERLAIYVRVRFVLQSADDGSLLW